MTSKTNGKETSKTKTETVDHSSIAGTTGYAEAYPHVKQGMLSIPDFQVFQTFIATLTCIFSYDAMEHKFIQSYVS